MSSLLSPSPKGALLLALALAFLLPHGAVLASGQQPLEDPPLVEARSRAAAGDLDGALVVLEQARNRGNGEPPLLAMLGGLYAQKERWQDALSVLEPLCTDQQADAAALYNAGRAALALGRIDDAERWLTESLGLEPQSPALRELGLFFAARGDQVEGFSLLVPWLRASPNDLEARRAAALLAVNLRRLPDARKLLQGLPEEPAIQLLRGRVASLADDPRNVVRILTPILVSGPEEFSSAARPLLAQAYLDLGEPEDAIGLLDGSLDRNPDGALLLVRALRATGQDARALEILTPFGVYVMDPEAGRQPPEKANQILVEIGALLIAAGDPANALRPLERAIDLSRDNPKAFKFYAEALAAVGRQSDAAAAQARLEELGGEEAIDRRPDPRLFEDPTGAAIRRAQALAASGETDLALEVLKREDTLAATDPRPVLLASRILQVADRIEESLALSRQAVARFSGTADTHYQLGTTLMAGQQRAEAEAAFRQALTLAPGHVPSLSDLGVLLSSLGRREEALALLRRASQLAPDDALIRQNLERIEREQP